MANILAKEFDLYVPDAVYMTVDPELIKIISIKQPEIYQKICEKSYDSILFGCKYHEGYPTYSPAKKDKSFELFELETIFAFDMLIANQDRRSEKPNILKGAEHYLLIDHEKAFEGLNVHLSNINKGIVPYYFKEHLFFEQLNKAAQKLKNSICFETFEEYFRILNLDSVEENVNFLIKQGYNKEECLSWLDYLQQQKENCRTFVTLLRNKICE
jgi:hypothetical protein